MQGQCDWSVVLPLYFGGVAWTLVYDTLYAHQDKLDDVKVGVKSTALLFGEQHTVPILSGFALAAIAGFGLAGYQAQLSLPFYAGLSMTATHLLWQVQTADLSDPKNLQRRFGSNKWLGGILFGSIVAGKWF